MAIAIELSLTAAGVEEATVLRWIKSEGDEVIQGDTLVEVETDKAVMEIEAEADGVLGRILVPDGTDDVPINSIIGVLIEPGEEQSIIEDYQPPDIASNGSNRDDNGQIAPEAESPLNRPLEDMSVDHSAEPDSRGDRIFATPLARRLAVEYHLDLATLDGSGPHGRIVRQDVENAHEAGVESTHEAGTIGTKLASAAKDTVSDLDESARVEYVPHTGMRKTIARRLGESKQYIPHFYATSDCQVDELLALRKQLNVKGEQATPEYQLSINDIVVFAVARALRRVPEVNSSWSDEAILRHQNVDVSVAVAVDGGLVTPVIREADRDGLARLSREIRTLSYKARHGKLTPSEYRGGGFTVSNLGMYGIREFAAIINPPQSAILAVGAVEKRPIVKNDELIAGHMMTLTLSADHRVVDGAVGARFLAELRKLLQDPFELLI